MPRLCNPFKSSKQAPQSYPEQPAPKNTSCNHANQTQQPSHLPQTTPAPNKPLPQDETSNSLDYIHTLVRLANVQIRHTHQLIDQDGAALEQIKNLKRKLKETHRELGKTYAKVEGEVGDEWADVLRDAGRRVWEAGRRLGRLKGEVRAGEEGELTVGGDGDGKEYLMSGALPVEDGEEYLMSDALPVENGLGDVDGDDDVDEEVMDVLLDLPRLMAYGVHSEGRNIPDRITNAPIHPTTNPTHPTSPEPTPPPYPLPRATVIALLRHEERNSSLHLHDPDRIRTGSCTGFTISQLLLFGSTHPSFVLPYLPHIPLRSLRSLKKYLIAHGHILKSATISRTEKLLHCMQLLRTGNRYESIAVVFSRSPRQVRAACQEVMMALEAMYESTVDEGCEADVCAHVWGIWKRFELNADEQGAARYYGFTWSQVAKVLVGLNLFIGGGEGEGGAVRYAIERLGGIEAGMDGVGVVGSADTQ
ncbi:hypothetical protein CC86DRAFT_471208 [Ophiobolus disseminans]|uniref:Uncharacterized protein n=1 Tax=Ophiobolus disseminans TaxID=1469910 RepID=A0A6A6ZJX5_9PLEO|nr:hypothetical protein CC86DRAFT_471208 [Ophiobolus disseminans]